VYPGDTEGFARGLRAALDNSDSYRETESMARLLRFHSIEHFTEGLTGRLRALTGKKSSTRAIEWSWVLEVLEPAQRTLN